MLNKFINFFLTHNLAVLLIVGSGMYVYIKYQRHIINYQEMQLEQAKTEAEQAKKQAKLNNDIMNDYILFNEQRMAKREEILGKLNAVKKSYIDSNDTNNSSYVIKLEGL